MIVVGCSAVRASAAAKPQSFDPNAASGLEISPAVVELNGERGKSYVLKLRVHNVTNSDLTYNSTVNDFGPKDETGSPRILQMGALPLTASMVSWVKSAGQLQLKSQESRQIDIGVTIPNNAEPGGHYGVVNFTGKDPQIVSSTVGVNVSTGLLLLVRVDGAVTEKMSLASLTTEQNNKQRSFFESSPITFVTRLHNEGNVHVKPTGVLEIRNMFGGLVSSLQVNEKSSNVLPNSVRRFDSVLNKDWMIGRYEANLTMGYGTKGQAIIGQVSFWVIPYRLLIVVALILATLGFIIHRLFKVYNRHVIKKYKQSHDNQTKTTKKK